MKKNKLLLLAGVCSLLTGCGGQKYTNIMEEDMMPGITVKAESTLTLKTTTFKMVQECSMSVTDAVGALAMLGGGVEMSYTFTYTGDALQSETNENEWKLTVNTILVSGYKSEGDGKKYVDEIYKTTFEAMFTEDTVKNIMEGKKVKVELEDDQKTTDTVVVDNENMTFTYNIF